MKQVNVVKTEMCFNITNIDDEEMVAIKIILDLLSRLNHSERHRVLDYFKDRFNVSEVKITQK